MRPRAKITFPSRCCAVRASSRLVPPAPPCTRRSISEHCAESRQPLGLVDKNYRRVRIAITTGRYREAQNRGRVAACAAWPGLPAGSERRLGDGAGTSSMRRKWWISSVGARSRHCLVDEGDYEREDGLSSLEAVADHRPISPGCRDSRSERQPSCRMARCASLYRFRGHEASSRAGHRLQPAIRPALVSAQ